MNHPYPELVTYTTALLAALTEWNAANEKARREYRRHPFAACGVTDCPRLARTTGRMCSSHAGPNVRGVK